MVTDGEIDRFFMRLIEYCFNNFAKERSPKKTSKIFNKTPTSSNSLSMSARLQIKKTALTKLQNESNEISLDNLVATDTEKFFFYIYKFL